MVSIRSLVSSVLLATAALAAPPTMNFTSSEINQLINPPSGSPPTGPTKLAWCGAQKTLCGTLCGGSTTSNECDQNQLTYNCTCSSNSSAPALAYYRNSLISNECFQILGNCLAAHANDLTSQQNCQNNYICGNATDAQASAAGANAAPSSTSASSSATGSAVAASSGTASSGAGVSSSTHGNAAMLSYGEYAPPMFVMMFVGALASFL